MLEKCLPKPAPVQTPMDAEEVRVPDATPTRAGRARVGRVGLAQARATGLWRARAWASRALLSFLFVSFPARESPAWPTLLVLAQETAPVHRGCNVVGAAHFMTGPLARCLPPLPRSPPGAGKGTPTPPEWETVNGLPPGENEAKTDRDLQSWPSRRKD